MRTIAFVIFIVYQKTTDTYDFVCPKTTQWQFRARSKCPAPNKYHCLADLLSNGNFTEQCLPLESSRFGFEAVYGNKIDFRLCKKGTYMPFPSVSNMGNECPFKMSTCSEEGQVFYNNRSPETDASCMCDYTEGYAFVQTPKNRCYCVPSTEDCSCYKKTCGINQVLSQDFICTSLTESLLGKDCQSAIAKPNGDNHYSVVPVSLELCPPEYKFGPTDLFFKLYIVVATLALMFVFVVGGACYSSRKEVVFIFDSGIQNMREECKLENLKKELSMHPKILEMCFVVEKNSLSLVYIDAENNYIVKQSVTGRHAITKTHIKGEKNIVNRLTKINDDYVAIIYKKQFIIEIYRTSDLNKHRSFTLSENDFENTDDGIQGIVSISADSTVFKFFVSNKSSIYKVEIKEDDTIINANKIAKIKFDTARRFAVSEDQKVLFVADEDNKSVRMFDAGCGKEMGAQETNNRGLQNVRSIAVTCTRLYAATANGVSVYKHTGDSFPKNQSFKIMIKYYLNVEHTRCLCLHKCEKRIYLALSFVRDAKDKIVVFSFEENDIFC